MPRSIVKPIKVLLADAQFLSRYGLCCLLADVGEVDLIGEATSEEELIACLQKELPDVLVLDYNQPEHFTLETVMAVRRDFPECRILVISSDSDRGRIYQAIEQEINSFLTKECGEEEIIDAIYATARGEKFFCNNIINHILERSFGKEDDCTPTPLTPREVEIVRLIASGLVAKQIAAELELSTHTVYTHRKNIMRKLRIGTASELVRYAFNQGLVTP